MVCLQLPLGEAQLLLQRNRWSVTDSITASRAVAAAASTCRIAVSRPEGPDSKKEAEEQLAAGEDAVVCDVCATAKNNFSHLQCGHAYCASCWELHFEYQIMQGISSCKIQRLILSDI